MSEVVSELQKIEEGLLVRISLLKAELVPFFLRDLERLRELIRNLKEKR